MTGRLKSAQRTVPRDKVRALSLRNYLLRHVQVFLYSLGELSRAPLSSMMTVAVIGIALALPSGLHVILKNVQHVTRGWDGAAQISLFLTSGMPDEPIAEFRQRLLDMPEIDDVSYISREQALEEFRAHSGFGEALDALDANPLPPVLVIHPTREQSAPAAVGTLLARLQALEQVDIAQLDLQWVKRLYGIMEIGRRGVFIVAALLALAVMLIIGNTIRLAIENRRDEIEIMKLIGATNAFIRRPFLYSGMWYGALGGLFAWLLISIGLWLLRDPVSRLSSLYHSEFQIAFLDAGTTLAMLFAGTLLGLLGSWLSVGRHLSAIEPV